MVQQTGDDGRFLFADVLDGDWELSADKRGFVSGRYGATRYDQQGRSVAVRPSEHVKDLVVALAPQATIAGRVLDTEGEPVEGARVAILKVIYVKGIPRWSEVGSAVTLDNGGYRIPRVPPGRYLVKCGITEVDVAGMKTTYGATYYPNAKGPSMAEAVDVRPDGGEINGIDIRVTLTPTFHIRGKLQPPDGQQDLGRAVLVNRDDPLGPFAVRGIDRSGYQIDFDRVPPGSYVLYAFYRGALAASAIEVKEHDIDNLLLSPAPMKFEAA